MIEPHYAYLRQGNATQLWHFYQDEGFNLSHSTVVGRYEVIFAEGTVEEYLKQLGHTITSYVVDSSHIQFQPTKVMESN